MHGHLAEPQEGAVTDEGGDREAHVRCGRVHDHALDLVDRRVPGAVVGGKAPARVEVERPARHVARERAQEVQIDREAHVLARGDEQRSGEGGEERVRGRLDRDRRAVVGARLVGSRQEADLDAGVGARRDRAAHQEGQRLVQPEELELERRAIARAALRLKPDGHDHGRERGEIVDRGVPYQDVGRGVEGVAVSPAAVAGGEEGCEHEGAAKAGSAIHGALHRCGCGRNWVSGR